MAAKTTQGSGSEQLNTDAETQPPAESTPPPAESTPPSDPTPPPAPTPDEFGRLRVRDRDTGHQLTIHAGELPHGNYTVLNQRASDRSGDPLPPKHATR
ncbi:MAG TPA: hypothetical protein VIP28_09160 [Nocardioides sp.]